MNVYEFEDQCAECGSENVYEELEVREGGNFELVLYCEGCGATAV
jgi:uncharacterized Zn finger protein